MNILPNIPGTVLNMPLQGDLTDISGNGLNGTSLDAGTNLGTPAVFATLPKSGSLQWLDVGAVTSNKVILPATPLLRFTGACTFQWLSTWHQSVTFSYFVCDDTASRNSSTPEARGSLYSIWSTRGLPHIADQFLFNDGHSGGPWTEFLPDPANGNFVTADWCGDVNPSTLKHDDIFAYTITRNASGTWNAYKNGLPIGVPVPSIGTNVASGAERFWIAGTEQSGGGGSYMAGIRVLNYERQPADVLKDAVATFGPPVAAHDSLSSRIANVSAMGGLYRYPPGAFGDQFNNPGGT